MPSKLWTTNDDLQLCAARVLHDRDWTKIIENHFEDRSYSSVSQHHTILFKKNSCVCGKLKKSHLAKMDFKPCKDCDTSKLRADEAPAVASSPLGSGQNLIDQLADAEPDDAYSPGNNKAEPKSDAAAVGTGMSPGDQTDIDVPETPTTDLGESDDEAESKIAAERPVLRLRKDKKPVHTPVMVTRHYEAKDSPSSPTENVVSERKKSQAKAPLDQARRSSGSASSTERKTSIVASVKPQTPRNGKAAAGTLDSGISLENAKDALSPVDPDQSKREKLKAMYESLQKEKEEEEKRAKKIQAEREQRRVQKRKLQEENEDRDLQRLKRKIKNLERQREESRKRNQEAQKALDLEIKEIEDMQKKYEEMDDDQQDGDESDRENSHEDGQEDENHVENVSEGLFLT